MSTWIKNVQKGNVRTLRALYEAECAQHLALSVCLLGDVEVARDVVTSAYKKAFDAVAAAKVKSEDAFHAHVLNTVVEGCRARLGRKNSKEMQIQSNRNYANVVYTSDSVLTDGKPSEQILSNLPAVQRAVYVLYWGARLTDRDIAAMLHTNAGTIGLILGAEEALIRQIGVAICEKTGADAPYDLDEFHRELANTVKQGVDSKEMGETVLAYAVSLFAPARKKTRMRLLIIGISLLLVIGIVVGGGVAFCAYKQTTYYAVIDIRDYGTIVVELDRDAAPITVDNFIDLAESGFYDGLTFHRIIEGFMMQGGMSLNDDSVQTIKGEFASNGYQNPIKHERGVISMARAKDPNSASSQFFIVHQTSPNLDGDYAAFGRVVSGMEVVDKICTTVKPISDDADGMVDTVNQPVINSIKIHKE